MAAVLRTMVRITFGFVIVAVVMASLACTPATSSTTPATSPADKPAAGPASSNTMSAAARTAAEALLAKYGLSTSGDYKQVDDAKLSSANEDFQLYAEVSGTIGIDMASHEGETATWYSVPLKPRSPDDGRLWGVFIVQQDSVIGAGLHTSDGSPGVEPLNAPALR